MKINILFLILFVTIFISCKQNEDFELIGKIKPKSALEIQTSDLWIGGEVLDRDLCDYDAYKEYLGELGAKKIRLQSGWAKTEKEKGVYDFAWLDHIVNDAISRGLQPWIQLSYGNLIYKGGGGISLSGGLPDSEEALEAWINYSKVVVNRYKDRVNEWEIWNEADHRNNLEFGSDESTYARLFVKTVEAIKSIQPDSKIVALSIAGVGRTDFVDGFFQYLKEYGDVSWVDIITFHGYPRNPDHGFDAVKKLVATATKYNPDIEFWQGETGCPSTLGSTGALSGYPWNEHIQAKWDLRRALAHTGRGYKFSLFSISEFVYDDAQRKGLNSKGILKIDKSDFSIEYAKPAYFAYQNLCSVFGQKLNLLDDLKYKAISDSSISVFAWTGNKDRPIVAYWNDNHIPSDNDDLIEFQLELEGLSFQKPVLVNVLNGEVKTIPKKSMKEEMNKVVFDKIPVYDSPMLIVEKELIEIQNI